MKANIKKIIELRKSKGISVNRFAELLGVSTRTVYNWENQKSNPGKTDLMAIAHLLELKLNDISDFKKKDFFTKNLVCRKAIHLKTVLITLKA
jgi:transcriptional regulator with XRE-family HTH domain